MKGKNWRILLLIAIVTSAVTMALSSTTGGMVVNDYFADFLYDRTSPNKGECIVIGIDEYAIDELGTWPWSRDIVADVIDILNEDPDNQPAAIAIDVLFTEATDEYADDRLAESLAANDNIIIACSAVFDSELTLNDNGVYVMEAFKIASMNYPYEAFEAELGHVNAMYDSDGVLRHHLFSYEYEGITVESMPYQAYTMWCETQGIVADFDPYVDENGFWYVEYSREPGDYFAYSIMDILEGSYDPDILTDAVVLIGTYEANSMDYFTTSANRSEKMYGIEYLANVTDAMISGTTKQYITAPFFIFSCLWIMAYTLILLKRSISQALAISGITTVVTIVTFLGMYEIGYILEPLWLLIGYVLGLVASIIYNYLTENRKRKEITNVFSRYVDGDIIKQLLKEDSESLGLEGKECEIAIMFTDVRGFTAMSEKLTPIEVVRKLNEYLTLTSSCIKNHGGVVDKFIGDATMAFWGAPLPCEDAVYQACQAGLEMVEKSYELVDSGIKFGIGVHYGPAVVGNIGAEDRMDFTAIGDTVNVGQRIESQAPGHTVYVSQVVVDILGDRIEAEPLETKLALKGKSEPMQIYILKNLR